jgi:lipid II:glycine glycyltransferase (peptidoglycan interpeptide bridge formation enzyme)
MLVRELGPEEKDLYNDFVAASPQGHLVQSWQWGEFKKSQGTPPIRYGVFDEEKLLATAQLTLHQLPWSKMKIAYLPKGPIVSADVSKILPHLAKIWNELAKEQNLIFLKIEPKVTVEIVGWETALANSGFKKSGKWLFTEYNFMLDLRPPEAEILAKMKKNGRYYIKFAEKKGVTTYLDPSEHALERHLVLQHQTADRQNFLVHTDSYYRDLWQKLSGEKMAYLLAAKYQNKIIASWMVLRFGKTLYYTFGAYDTAHKDLNAMYALAWAAIKLGKSLGCETLDMWGAANPELGERQAIWGSHQFKENFGPDLVHYLGPHDLAFKPNWYKIFSLTYDPALKVLRWFKR